LSVREVGLAADCGARHRTFCGGPRRPLGAAPAWRPKPGGGRHYPRFRPCC